MPQGFSTMLQKGDPQEVQITREQKELNTMKKEIRNKIVEAARNGNSQAVNYMMRKYGPGGDDRTTIFNMDEFQELQSEIYGMRMEERAARQQMEQQQGQRTVPTPGVGPMPLQEALPGPRTEPTGKPSGGFGFMEQIQRLPASIGNYIRQLAGG